ncbi:ABC transporter permease [Nostocoides australiense]|nr:hypothetical protein [Tetrasphaera sp.]HPF81840.1 hypothetical protein [Tetrasphaera australiensis]HRW02498.1 hypothetical protein [Tetrasphaera sp.]
MTGTLRILVLHLRTARRMLLAWALGLSLLVVLVARSLTALYPDLGDRIAYATSSSSSQAAIALNGRWGDLTTLGGITTNEVGFLGFLVFPLAGVLIAVGLTRRQEDFGRVELLTSGRLGRLAPLAGALLAGVLAILAFGVIATAGLIAVDLPAAGALRYAALLTVFALSWLAIGAVCAEVSQDGRTATGFALLLILAAYVARTVVDAAGWDLGWWTPMGWLPLAAPFGAWRWQPYAALTLLTILAATVAGVVARHRDLGSGLIVPRPGPAFARTGLGTPLGYAWRMTRGITLAWLVGLGVWSVALGALSADMTSIVRANPQLLEVLGIDMLEDFVTSLALVIGALGAAALGVQGIARLSQEEAAGRLGLVLATPVERRRLIGVWGALIAVGSAVVILAQGLLTGLATWASTGSRDALGRSLWAALVLTVPVLLVVAFALALRGLHPAWDAATWVVVGWGAVVGFLGTALDLPAWARDLSPIEAVGRVPMADPRPWPLGILLLGGLALAVLGVHAAGRRDLAKG